MVVGSILIPTHTRSLVLPVFIPLICSIANFWRSPWYWKCYELSSITYRWYSPLPHCCCTNDSSVIDQCWMITPAVVEVCIFELCMHVSKCALWSLFLDQATYVHASLLQCKVVCVVGAIVPFPFPSYIVWNGNLPVGAINWWLCVSVLQSQTMEWNQG